RAAAAALGVLADAPALDLLDLLQQLEVDAVLVDDVARRVGGRDRDAAELLHLLDRVDRDVAGSRDHRAAALEARAAGAEHLLREDRGAVARRLLAHERSAPVEPLAREHARLVTVGEALVLAEEVSDLARADADVARGHVGVLADVAVQLGHERLAEAHDLAVGLAGRVEVAAALAAADRQARERVLEDLLEAEELDDAEVHRLAEAQPALVRAE